MTLLRPVLVDKDIAITAPKPPEIIPQTSPTISLHILDILFLFLSILIASLAPLIFLLAIA